MRPRRPGASGVIIFNPTWEEAATAAAGIGALSAALLYRGKALAGAGGVDGDPGQASRPRAAGDAREPGSTPHLTDQRARTARTARRLTVSGRFARETALVIGLFALWQFAGSFSVMGPDGALGRAQWLWDAERALHLPSEAWLQRQVLPHPLLTQAFNLYYDTLHFPVLIACLIWLFIWHRDRYGPFRVTLVVFTGLCLLIQLIPVAPPRMLSGIGMVDSAALYGQSVYSSAGGFEADQLSAMPSVHVGWAILVAIAAITVLRSWWRWLAPLYPVLTTIAVAVTANHFWLDGVAAGIVLAVVLVAQAAARRLLARRTAPRAAQEPVSRPAGVMTRSGGR